MIIFFISNTILAKNNINVWDLRASGEQKPLG